MRFLFQFNCSFNISPNISLKQKGKRLAHLFFLFVFLLLVQQFLIKKSYAADNDSTFDSTTQNNQRMRDDELCNDQKKIWAGFSEPVNYLKPEDYKNIFLIKDHSVKDDINGLEWKICPEGQQYINGECFGQTTFVTWDKAPSLVQGKNYDGKYDWRVPTIDELETIVDYCTKTDAYFNSVAFPKTDSGIYWSSSDDPGFYNEYVAWYLDFSTSISSFLDKGRLGRVRAVRTLSQ